MSGHLIWVPDDKAAWAAAKVLEVKKGKYVRVQMNPLSGDGKEKKIDGDISKFETTNADELSMECENLATLNSFNEGLILHHVKQRFSRGTIYTSVGAILVAVNPYRSLPIYEVDLMQAIWNKMKTEAALVREIHTTILLRRRVLPLTWRSIVVERVLGDIISLLIGGVAII